MTLLCLFLSLALVIQTTQAQTDPPCGLTDTQKTAVLAEHNNARRIYANPQASNMIELRWDPLLAATAYNYMVKLKCTMSNFTHNANRTADYKALGGTNGASVGENWYSGKADNATDGYWSSGVYNMNGGAVNMWIKGNCMGYKTSGGVKTCTSPVCSEYDYFYNLTNPSTGATCNTPGTKASAGSIGHFTQVMWAKTAWVGCGLHPTCGTTCNYAISGNSGDITVPSWTAGTPGSACPSGYTANNGLCAAGTTAPTQTQTQPQTTQAATTQAPVQTTQAPVQTTQAPVQTTQAPVQTTQAPVQTTQAPVQTTQAPVQTTQAPVQTTQAPVQTTQAPVQTTQAPVQTTQAPVQTTQAPVQTTQAPVQTTEAPVQTTQAPVQTTQAPVQTTQAPVQTTQAPVQTTQAPVQTTQAPVQTTQAPVQTTQAPVQTTQAPVQTTQAPVQTTQAPVQTTQAPVQTTQAPVQTTQAPVQTTQAPVQTTQAPSNDPPCGLTDTQKAAVLAEHNNARRIYANPTASNMLELRWDPLLAATAYNYMVRTKCTMSNFSHNANRTADYKALGGNNAASVGENWYSGKADNATDGYWSSGVYNMNGGAVNMWIKGNCMGYKSSGGVKTCTSPVCSEYDYFYNLTNPSTGANCNPTGTKASSSSIGHFTQVMWAKTAWVGCGMHPTCGTTCDYAVAGNSGDITVPSWSAGTPGSACPSGYANNNGLCTWTGTTATTAVPQTTTQAPTVTASQTTAKPTSTQATTSTQAQTTTSKPQTTTQAPQTTTQAPQTTQATTSKPTTTNAGTTPTPTRTSRPTSTPQPTPSPTPSTTKSNPTTTTKQTTPTPSPTPTSKPGSDPPCGLTDAQKQAILSEHNNARKAYANPVASNMIELRWDPLLAATGYNYLVKTGCTMSTFQHNANRLSDYKALGGANGASVGENWYSGLPDNVTDPEWRSGNARMGGGAVNMWIKGNCMGTRTSGGVKTCSSWTCSEYDYFYNQANPSTGSPCSPSGVSAGQVGHFTQVMWAKTAWVGCGWTSSCGTICDYAIAGNSGDYTKAANVWAAGAAGSACPTGYTNNGGLCKATSGASVSTQSTPWTTYLYIGLGAFVFILLVILIAYVLYGGIQRRRSTMGGMNRANSVGEAVSLQEKFDGFENLKVPQSPSQSAIEPEQGATELATYSAGEGQMSPGAGQVAAVLKEGWEKCYDAERGAYYYYNHTDGTTQWDAPEGFAESP